ncbi:MAG: hypothetical protein M1818_002123 [Claussenomyces sp. TS43310]|nr:MAG: hypothetical protein M1818_002123 [Claussenomyces sp. TS43310]
MANHAGVSSRTKINKGNPVIRKFAQPEKHSVDLDRPAVEQGLCIYSPEYESVPRSARDVNLNQAAKDGYHKRSTSGTSQFSSTTSGSAPRTGPFIHPFQQTPRPYTPPAAASYHGSLMGSEYSRESHKPPEAKDSYMPHMFSSTTKLSRRGRAGTSHVPRGPALHIQTMPTSSTRLTEGNSQTNLHSTRTILSPDLASPADTVSPMSAVRTSMDMEFRIRSRSEVDTRARRDSIQEARRKFHEKEQAKAEKVAQQEVRELEKRNTKEARRVERSVRKSTASDGTRSKRSKSDLTIPYEKENEFVGRDYDTAEQRPPPNMGDDSLKPPRRSRAASGTKKKTHGAWTTFMMWFRTRLLRMGRSGRA